MAVVLLDNARDEDGVSYLYEAPYAVVCADEPGQVPAALKTLEAAVAGGAYAAGFFAYELGACFEPRLHAQLHAPRATPLLWFGLFRSRQQLKKACVQAWLENTCKGGFEISSPVPDWNEADYAARFTRVQEYIHAGDIYQANLTFRARLHISGDRAGLYARLRAVQPVSYGAYISAPDFSILSLSPELFVRKTSSFLEVLPMKGTAPRGRWAAEDEAAARDLQVDEKSRAENLMIVDLMRNDVGRLCETGSVAVPHLFSTETHRTLHQMTSKVTGRMRPGVGLEPFVRALFPSGSVTGAPKIRAQQIIAACESGPRGVYTGAIGHFSPDDAGGFEACFNVAIRTLVISPDGQAEIGIGSGVVADSRAGDEYRECLLKMKFLGEKPLSFQLIETLLWQKGRGFAFLPQHLARLSSSARYFRFPCDEAACQKVLATWEAAGGHAPRQRVRLVLAASGALAISATALAANPPSWHYVLSDRRVNSAEAWLYHKTTQRDFLDEEREIAQKKYGADEVLFLNERGELTQGSYTNLFLEMADGRLLTPALSCGLLPGVLRQSLLDEGRAEEAVLLPAHLVQAKQVYFGNAVRGLMPAIRSVSAAA